MTKSEYEEQRKKIIETFGKPVFDMAEPQNESAKRCNALLSEYRQGVLSAKRVQNREKGMKVKPETVREIAENITSEQKNRYSSIPIPEINLSDNDLIAFTDDERDVIIQHFNNMNLTHLQLSAKCKLNRQQITALLHSPAYRVLESKVFDKLMPTETRLSLLRCVRGNDSKITQRLAEHYKILNPEKVEIDLNKPIDDPKALKLLKELGDKLIDGESNKT